MLVTKNFSQLGNRWPVPHHIVDVSGMLDGLVEQRRLIDERIARIQEHEKFNSLSTMERLTSLPPEPFWRDIPGSLGWAWFNEPEQQS